MVVTEYWTRILQQRGSVDIIYLEFKKAFDLVSHRRQLTKLMAYYIDGIYITEVDCSLSCQQEATCGYEQLIVLFGQML